MLQGERFNGLKLVQGRSYRNFTNEQEVIKILTSNGFEPQDFIKETLVSVSTLEKLLGKTKFKELLDELIIKPKGAPTITKVEDPRKEFNSAELDFEHIEKI